MLIFVRFLFGCKLIAGNRQREPRERWGEQPVVFEE
jgi:hypothetical protein